MKSLLKPLAITAILIAAPVVAHGQQPWTQDELRSGIKKEE